MLPPTPDGFDIGLLQHIDPVIVGRTFHHTCRIWDDHHVIVALYLDNHQSGGKKKH